MFSPDGPRLMRLNKIKYRENKNSAPELNKSDLPQKSKIFDLDVMQKDKKCVKEIVSTWWQIKIIAFEHQREERRISLHLVDVSVRFGGGPRCSL